MSADITVPNISRIYDYVLGGHNNFDVDRQAAERIMQVFPAYPRWAKLNRWFLQLVAEQWKQQGYSHILDLGSGIPTQGHLHTILTDAKILYTDNDPIAVSYARELLKDVPHVCFEEVDVRDPDAMLRYAEEFFAGERKVAIGCIGVAYLVDDNNLRNLVSLLHEWSTPGTVMAMTVPATQTGLDDTDDIVSIFKRQNVEIFIRSEEQIRSLISPWRVVEFKPLTEWLHTTHLMQESDYLSAGSDFYGILFEHAGT
ncbi:MAG: SAM-dependent methyltransferase [Chloroflexota bacterium]